MAQILACACALLLLCGTAARLPAAPAVPVADAGPATWPDRGPYQKVGSEDDGLNNVRIPVPVATAVLRLVSDAPSQWSLFGGLHDFAGHGWRILQVCADHGYLTLLVARGSWTILSVPASLPVLNEVLDPLSPANLQKNDKPETYLWHIVLLRRYSQGTFLDGDFQRTDVDTPRYKLWLRGTESRRQALRVLCHDPVLTRVGDRVSVRLNVINNLGAMEEWIFHLWVGNIVRLEGTEVRPVRRDHTFFYPLI